MKPQLPNIRKLFIPDPGYTMFDVDLAGADAQVVAWAAEDENLMAAFRAGLDIHDFNATDMFGTAYTSLAGDTKSGPKARKRKEVKQGVHLTNYGGSAKTLARVLGWTIHEADTFQRRWFSLRPGIRNIWHRRVELELSQHRTVTNAFGYKRTYFGRIEQAFTEALAWEPQSTVALVTFEAALQLTEDTSPLYVPWVQLLLQVHDSLIFQVPTERQDDLEPIKAALRVVVPYPQPLIIPWGFTRSTRSWGHCDKFEIAAKAA